MEYLDLYLPGDCVSAQINIVNETTGSTKWSGHLTATSLHSPTVGRNFMNAVRAQRNFDLQQDARSQAPHMGKRVQ